VSNNPGLSMPGAGGAGAKARCPSCPGYWEFNPRTMKAYCDDCEKPFKVTADTPRSGG
jgi:hypothetical protein